MSYSVKSLQGAGFEWISDDRWVLIVIKTTSGDIILAPCPDYENAVVSLKEMERNSSLFVDFEGMLEGDNNVSVFLINKANIVYASIEMIRSSEGC